jgi:pimeloyl-ACP methyl ester carboxylesterase
VLARESPAAGDGGGARGDARPLTFDDVGDPAGVPVLYFHGGGDSRLSRHPDDEIAASLGVRLVAVDRCGPSVRGRTLVRWAREVEELADGLGLDRFAVLGWSAGGPHALAVGAVLPERVTRLALVGSMPPPRDTRLLPVDVQRTMRIARVSPWLAAKALERWGRRPPPATGDPDTDRAYALGRAESFRHGGMWLARELAALGRPWGFDLAAVQAHVDLWWGDRDHVCPPAIGEDFARVLPHATLHLVEGTHQLLFQRWRDILAGLVADPA